MQKPRLATLPALMFAGGLGMVMYYGHAWWRLPDYNEADIEASVELNLAADLLRRDTAFRSDPARIEALRGDVQEELTRTIAAEKTEVRRYTATGLVLLLVGLAQMILMRRWAAR